MTDPHQDQEDILSTPAVRCPHCDARLGEIAPALEAAAYIVSMTLTCPTCGRGWSEFRGAACRGTTHRVWTPATPGAPHGEQCQSEERRGPP